MTISGGQKPLKQQKLPLSGGRGEGYIHPVHLLGKKQVQNEPHAEMGSRTRQELSCFPRTLPEVSP